MKGRILGKNIVGMADISSVSIHEAATEETEVNKMVVEFTLDGQKFEEEIDRAPGTLPINAGTISILTKEGHKLRFTPRSKRDILQTAAELGLDKKRTNSLLENY